MTDQIDIQEPIREICQRLGLVAANVRRIDFAPSTVTAEVFRLNEQGAKYVDEETGAVATEYRMFNVRT